MASTKGVYFNGKLITLPGAYSTVESSMTTTRAGAQAKVLALMGECTGGEPGVVQFFSEPNVAKRVLKSGDLLMAAQKAWNPVSRTKQGVELGGAFTIACIRTNEATKGRSEVRNAGEPVPASMESFATVGDNTTGGLSLSGTYTGTEEKTIEVVISGDGEGAAALADMKYNWHFSGGADKMTDPVAMTTDPIALEDGIIITFSEGNFTAGDMFTINAKPAAASNGDKIFEIQSKDWGLDANAIQHKMDDGTTKGTKKLTLFNSQTDAYEVYDNLGGLFSVKYTGEQPYAAITVVVDKKGKATRLQTFIGADEATAIMDLDIELTLKSFKNIKALCNYIAGYEGYETTLFTAYSYSLSVQDIDPMDKASIIPENEDDVGTPVTAVMCDLQKTLALQSQMCEVPAITRTIMQYDNYPYTALTGGSEGESPNSWIKYLDMLAAFNITYLVPLTDDLSIIAECREHVEHMSDDMGREQRMMCGRGNGLTVELAISDALRLGSDRVQYIFPGMYDQNNDGEIELYPAYILAAQHAGRAAFLPDGEAATHDYYRMTGIEYELSPDDITRLLNAGVVTFEFVVAENVYDSAAVRLVQDITTHTSDLDPLYVERAIGITADMLNKDIRKELDDLLVGKRTVSATLTTARNAVLTILKKRVKDEIIVAYKDVNVYKENGAVWVDYSVAPSEPTNFVLIRSHFYSEQLSAASDVVTAGGSTYGVGITDMNTVI